MSINVIDMSQRILTYWYISKNIDMSKHWYNIMNRINIKIINSINHSELKTTQMHSKENIIFCYKHVYGVQNVEGNVITDNGCELYSIVKLSNKCYYTYISTYVTDVIA